MVHVFPIGNKYGAGGSCWSFASAETLEARPLGINLPGLYITLPGIIMGDLNRQVRASMHTYTQQAKILLWCGS